MHGDGTSDGSPVRLDELGRTDHALSAIRPLVNALLVNAPLEHLWAAFDQIYSPIGRPSIPTEQLL